MSRRGRSAPPHDEVKYPPGVGPRIPSDHRPVGSLERLVFCHVGIFVVGITWAFGGGAEWLRPELAWWGSLGALLTLTALQDREAIREGWLRPLWWLLPWLAFNAFVLAGCLNPSFRVVKFGAEALLVNDGGHAGFPSSARPLLGLHALWLFDALWISCFNLVLVVRQRRTLRALLLVAVVNALVLAVFGTLQKLVGAQGIFFGAQPSPQPYFFASFIYHNHWGAYAVLMMAACLGLVWHFARRQNARGFFHSPAFGGVIAVFFIALSVPLSTSRSCTALTVVLLGGAWCHWLVRLARKRRRFRESIVLPLGVGLATIAVAAAGIWYVARDTIVMRFAKTEEQFQEIRARGDIGSRAELYRNTWTMARAKPWFGWGMASYPHVFTLYNTRQSIDQLPVFYRDAHSDWLQALAEHGFAGTTLLGLCGLVPLLSLRRRHLASILPRYLLAGCALILLYAWVEFPFGNLAVVLSWWLCFFSAVQYGRLHDREPSAAKAPATPARLDAIASPG